MTCGPRPGIEGRWCCRPPLLPRYRPRGGWAWLLGALCERLFGRLFHAMGPCRSPMAARMLSRSSPCDQRTMHCYGGHKGCCAGSRTCSGTPSMGRSDIQTAVHPVDIDSRYMSVGVWSMSNVLRLIPCHWTHAARRHLTPLIGPNVFGLLRREVQLRRLQIEKQVGSQDATFAHHHHLSLHYMINTVLILGPLYMLPEPTPTRDTRLVILLSAIGCLD